jgi:hypothetical protein
MSTVRVFVILFVYRLLQESYQIRICRVARQATVMICKIDNVGVARECQVCATLQRILLLFVGACRGVCAAGVNRVCWHVGTMRMGANGEAE